MSVSLRRFPRIKSRAMTAFDAPLIRRRPPAHFRNAVADAIVDPCSGAAKVKLKRRLAEEGRQGRVLCCPRAPDVNRRLGSRAGCFARAALARSRAIVAEPDSCLYCSAAGAFGPPEPVFKSPHAKKLELRVKRPNTILNVGNHATHMSAPTADIANMYPERL